jgi:hypothetical protein
MHVFISYHTPDREKAVALCQAILSASPGTTVFLDQSNLRFGHNWQPALYAAIEEADVFLTLIGNRLGNWQTAEYYAAQDKKVNRPDTFVLLPIIIADRTKGPVPNLPGLSQLHWIECSEPTAPTVLPLIIGAISGKQIPEAPKPWMLVNPYRGLMALEEQDSDFFFGREAETEQTIGEIVKYPNKIISLIGNSGVGKSSLVYAGVIAGLRRQKLPSASEWPEKLRDSREWTFITFRPADEPVKALVSAFANLWFPSAIGTERLDAIDEYTDRLLVKGHISELLDDTRRRFEELKLTPPKRALLYIDQGEELYSRSREADTARLSRLIAEASESKDFVLMISQRADYYGSFQANRELFDRSAIVDVPPLRPPELLRVLREPAARLSVGFYPPELPEQLVDASKGQPGALALLADLMIDVWEKMQRRGKDGIIRALEDARIIDVEKALASRADRFLAEHPDERPIIERLFVLRLVKIYEQGVPFRRRVLQSACSEDEWEILTAMSQPEWRLIVTAIENGAAFAEVAHDILLSKWPVLAEWISRERKFLLWRTDSDRDYQYWTNRLGGIDHVRALTDPQYAREVQLDRGDNALLKGARLEEAQAYVADRENDIDEHVVRFVERSGRIAQSEALAIARGAPSGDRASVYLSYSRDDSDAADGLRLALESHGFDVAFDRRSISGGESWQRRLHELIRSADAVVFLLSPSSASSSALVWEIDQATRLFKRVIPFLVRELGDVQPPLQLAAFNWIVASGDRALRGGQSRFQQAVNEVIAAIRTDLVWVKEHTRLMHRAMEWDEGGRAPNRLLAGSDISLARDWLAARPRAAPEPAALQVEFIRASEQHEHGIQKERERAESERERVLKKALAEAKAAKRQQRILWVGIMSLLVIAAGLAATLLR